MMAAFLLTGFAACTEEDVLAVSPDEVPTVTPDGGSFQWTRAEDVETRQEFLRNFGVGYSYNAVRGAYCDWLDIRCQVLNRNRILALQEMTGEQLLSTDLSPSVMSDSKFTYTLRDYVVNMDLTSDDKIDLGLYSKEKRTRQCFIEDGVQETYFYSLSQKTTLAHQYVGLANLYASYIRDESMLTRSFRNAVNHLRRTAKNDFAAIDSFINVWGTHVIVESWLGSMIRVDLRNSMWRWTALAKDEAWTMEEFLGEVAKTDERRETSEKYRWMEHSRINIVARGGDQKSLTGLLGEHRFDGRRSFSTEGIRTWHHSVKYDPDDSKNSNVEMVDMKVVPIWDFAALISERVALRIKAAVLQDANLMQQLLGDKNFFDASFPIRYENASCQWRKDTGTWQQAARTDSEAEPMVVNIMSGGRYVATVCHETIDTLSMWVCYPIYDGRIKQAAGLGVDDSNHIYNVRWIGGVATVSPLEKVTDSQNFYINGGAVKLEPQEGITYPEFQALPYVELSGGVRPDGTYAASAYHVQKVGETFQLLAPAGLTDIVGFTDTGESSGNSHIYKRNDEYVYIYNQNEVK